MIISSNSIKLLHVFYYALCLIPVAFGFFMFAGIFEKSAIISKAFSSFGFMLLASLLVFITLCPFFRMKVSFELGVAKKWIEFLGMDFFSKTIQAESFIVKERRQVVTTSDYIGSYKFMKLEACVKGEPKIFISALESSLFKINLVDLEHGLNQQLRLV